jgi:hypothetical protein
MCPTAPQQREIAVVAPGEVVIPVAAAGGLAVVRAVPAGVAVVPVAAEKGEVLLQAEVAGDLVAAAVPRNRAPGAIVRSLPAVRRAPGG